MPNCITNGVILPVMLHHVCLEFHLSFLGHFRSLLKFVQRHIALHTKGTPRLLKVMCREHFDNTLIHRLQQRRGVRQVSRSRRVKWSFNALKPGADFSSFMMYVHSGIFLPLQARFIHIKNLLGLITPILDDGPQAIWVGNSSIGALSLSRALDIMENQPVQVTKLGTGPVSFSFR